MPRLTLDTSEATPNVEIEPGVYTFELLSISDVKKGAKASYVTTISRFVEDGLENRKVYHNLPIDGPGASIATEFFSKITGEDEETFFDGGSVTIDTDDLIGVQFRAAVKNEVYQGRSSPKFTAIIGAED